MPVVSTFPPPKDIFDAPANADDDDDDEGWQDMPVVREDTSLSGLDEEDQKKYHYQPSSSSSLTSSTSTSASSKKATANATGTRNHMDVDDRGNEWRSKLENQHESEYTRLRASEEDDAAADEVHLRTRYLFDEDKAMTPLSQMQATKGLLTEAQRIAYVGLCALTTREMVQALKLAKRKELKASIQNMELWALKIMGRLYYHMELETQEQKMIESLAEHGVLASDLVPALMTTHTVANPEYDPEEARRKESEESAAAAAAAANAEPDRPGTPDSISDQTLVNEPLSSEDQEEGDATPKGSQSPLPPPSPSLAPPSPNPQPTTTTTTTTSPSPNPPSPNPPSPNPALTQTRTTTKVLQDTATAPLPGVSTSLSRTDASVTLDIRWTVLCDLFLILIADSMYDARSRVLLEHVASKLGLGWLDVVKFESRISEALEIQEDVETLEQRAVVEGAARAGRRRRYVMLGLATLGGGLVIGLSAGLLAPVIGLGLAGALSTVGVTGTGAFLGGTAGAAVITTGGVLTGSGIAVKGMVKRTQQVRTFDVLPLHNNKRVNCILTVPGFLTGPNDDPRLPFSVLDPIVGDVFSVLWEPEMIRETGSALKILTGEVLSQIGMTVLQATVMTGLMTALQWPIILTKLGYLIDNPWSNALDRARAAGRVLADVLINRHLGVRPITLIGFSLGARVIFYALLELANQKAFGIVQDVFLLGATLTSSTQQWLETRSVVSGRYVNAYAKSDWVLNYLFRATSAGVKGVAGLGEVKGVPGLENVDVTDKIAGHMSYRTFMPLILDQLGFPVFEDYFDEPEEPEFDEDRVVIREEDTKKKTGWFSSSSSSSSSSPNKKGGPQKYVQRPPSAATFAGVNQQKKGGKDEKEGKKDGEGGEGGVDKPADEDDDELPPRMDTASPHPGVSPASGSGRNTPTPSSSTAAEPKDAAPSIPLHAGFDLSALQDAVKEVESSGASASAGASPKASGDKEAKKKSFFTRLVPPSPAPLPATRSRSTPPSQVVEGAYTGASASAGTSAFGASGSLGGGHGAGGYGGHVRSSSGGYADYDHESGKEGSGEPVPAVYRSFSTPLSTTSTFSTSTAALGNGDMKWASASTSSLSDFASSSRAHAQTFGKPSLAFGSPFGYGDEDDDENGQGQATARPAASGITMNSLSLGLPPEDDITPSWGLGSSSSLSNPFASSSSSSSSSPFASATGSGLHSSGFNSGALGVVGAGAGAGAGFGSPFHTNPSTSSSTSPSLTFGSAFEEGPSLSFGGVDGSLDAVDHHSSALGNGLSLGLGNGLDLGLGLGSGPGRGFGVGLGERKEDTWSIPPLGGFGAGGGTRKKGAGGLDGAAGFGSNPWS